MARSFRHAVFAALAGVGTLPLAAQETTSDLFRDLQWRNIGPANMAGRVTDIEAVESNFAHVYVAAASGGLWKSTNAGTTWDPIFTEYGTANMGDIAIYQPNPDIVWVGTGESCTRNSVGWGDGVYKSTDGGETFVNMGLRDTHHIGEVLTHPSDPDIVYVAAQGHLWGHTGERGLFKTTDGGRSWRQLTNGLPDDNRTGATDITMDPSNPDILYTAFWECVRRPYRFDSGGPTGGIFKSTDGGETWTKLTRGLPQGDTGKIGLSVCRADPNIVMAIVEHGSQPAPRIRGRPNPEYEDMSRLGTGVYRSEDAGATWHYVNRYNNRPFYYSHIYIDPNDDQQVYVLAGSANVSRDGGRTFTRNFQGISGDFHALWINPAASDVMYVGNDKGSYVTFDRGHTFTMFDNMDIGQFYAVSVDNRDPYWVYGGLQDNGNWGGPSNSRDWNGVLNDHWFKFHSGDGFHTTVDPNDWRTVYTESQGGNIRRLDAVFRQQGKSITPNPSNVLNLAAAAPDHPSTGNRLARDYFRFNWSSPLVLSPHNSHTVLFGGNHLFRSTDRAATRGGSSVPTSRPTIRSSRTRRAVGLTRDVTQAETHATLITVSESPLTPGLIWTGTDDGNVHVTRDDGASWTPVRSNIRGVPDRLWVSRVVASRFAEGTAYVTFDGHRSDDFRPWVFKTTDYGNTWESIASNLPDGHCVYVIVEDVRNPHLLFVGTEFAVFATVDGGESWSRLMEGMPTVAVHDLALHPRDGDLIAATHGRSVWILDDLGPLQQLDEAVIARDVHVFRSRTATQWRGISRGATRGHKLFQGRNPLTIEHRPPGNSPSELVNHATIDFYLRRAPTASITLEVSDLSRQHTFSTDVSAHAGINRFFWNMRFNPTEQQIQAREQQLARLREQFGGQRPGGFGRGPVPGTLADPGTYVVTLTVHGESRTGTVTIRPDPAL